MISECSRGCLIYKAINNQITHRYWSGLESLPGFAAPATAGAGRTRALAAAFCLRPLEFFSSRATSRPGARATNKILQMCTDSLTRCRIGAFGLQDERRIRANKRKSFSIQDSAANHPIGPLIKLDVTWNYNSTRVRANARAQPATADPRAQSAYRKIGTRPWKRPLQRRRLNPLYSATNSVSIRALGPNVLSRASGKSTEKLKVHVRYSNPQVRTITIPHQHASHRLLEYESVEKQEV